MSQTKQSFIQKFNACRPVLSALGDENRQLIIRILIENCAKCGLRVKEIQAGTNISRTAVSHHLKVLKEAGIIKMRRAGTKNYYYIDPESSSLHLAADFWQETITLMDQCPLQKKKGR